MKDIEREVMLNTILSPKLVMQDTKRLKGRWFKIVQEVFRPTFGVEIEFPLKGGNRSSWICDESRNIISRIEGSLYSNHLHLTHDKKLKKNKFGNTSNRIFERNLINIGYDCNHPELDMYCSLTALTTMDKVLEISRKNTVLPNGIHNLHVHIPRSEREFTDEDGRTRAVDYKNNSPYPELNRLMRELVYSHKTPEQVRRIANNNVLANSENILISNISRYNYGYKTIEYRGMTADLSYSNLMKQIFIINMFHKSIYTKDHKVEKYLELLPIIETL